MTPGLAVVAVKCEDVEHGVRLVAKVIPSRPQTSYKKQEIVKIVFCYFSSKPSRRCVVLGACATPRAQPLEFLPMSIPTMRIPRIWDQEAHRLYCQGKLEAAVNKALQNVAVNVALFVQACYYTFMHKDYAAALCFATEYLKRRPDDVEMLNNASACCTRLHKYREAIGYSERGSP